MNIVIPKETFPGETRAAATPASVTRLCKLGASLFVEAGLGQAAGFPDAAYEKAGAKVISDKATLFKDAHVVFRVRKPSDQELSLLNKGTIHISFLDPFNEKDLLAKLAAQGVSAMSVEMVPRTTRCQKMDAITSQANLAGYVSVILGASYLKKIFPMMSTAAGTLLPAKVFIIGAGVAGLQAIATARRLGAKVEAIDTRPVAAEQIQSLGAKAVVIDIGETGQTAQGYAKELTPDQVKMQQEGMKKICASSDLVITTAQLFGKKAPITITAEMVAAMQYGSVIVDLAVESGGNVVGSKLGEVVDVNGVSIVGFPSLAGRVPQNASQVYAMNLVGMVEDLWSKDKNGIFLNPEDDVVKSCLITHEGAIWNEKFKTQAV
ncbi:MAG: Re/Si-specific NAD(P)(+) transhydrogenase subunit alpha [Verrucomicrobiota bacterium]|nr:Re/Si-specific NAD(P)(+) transhydrogenase subunit alpha [Verrucomicrobiota bacterium]